jgi:5-methyltetrahydrofolate--homocysteine methyltransferase
MIDRLIKELNKRIVILDGPRGTMLQKRNLSEEQYRGEKFRDHKSSLKGNHDILSITQPKVVEEIFDEYLKAGSDIIGTNTFNANPVSQADYGTEAFVYEMNVAAAQAARRSAEKFSVLTPQKPRYVAGAMGPTNKTLSLSPDVNDPRFY